jgi:hypothetical protein
VPQPVFSLVFMRLSASYSSLAPSGVVIWLPFWESRGGVSRCGRARAHQASAAGFLGNLAGKLAGGAYVIVDKGNLAAL